MINRDIYLALNAFLSTMLSIVYLSPHLALPTSPWHVCIPKTGALRIRGMKIKDLNQVYLTLDPNL